MKAPNVLLDLDGTLTDPREGIVGCFRFALTRMNVTCPNDAELARFIGPPLRESIEQLLPSANQALREEALTLFRTRFSSTGMFENFVYPGITSALTTLLDSGARLFVVTSKPQVFAKRIVEHFGLDHYFSAVHGSELGGALSSKGALIAHALKSEGLEPSGTIMVGDRAHDVLGAHANDVQTVGVLWGYGSREELAAAGATYLCEHPAELGKVAADHDRRFRLK